MKNSLETNEEVSIYDGISELILKLIETALSTATQRRLRNLSVTRPSHESNTGSPAAPQVPGQPSYSQDEAYALTQALIANGEKLAVISGAAWKQAVAIANLVPVGFPYRGVKIERDLQKARKAARRAADLSAIPDSATMHVGVLGIYDQALVREIDRTIGTKWLAVDRLFQMQPVRLVFDHGKPNGERRRSDENLSYYIGIPDDRDPRITTAIICSREKAAILRLHGMVGWGANLTPDLEAYFRRMATFDWEADS